MKKYMKKRENKGMQKRSKKQTKGKMWGQGMNIRVKRCRTCRDLMAAESVERCDACGRHAGRAMSFSLSGCARLVECHVVYWALWLCDAGRWGLVNGRGEYKWCIYGGIGGMGLEIWFALQRKWYMFLSVRLQGVRASDRLSSQSPVVVNCGQRVAANFISLVRMIFFFWIRVGTKMFSQDHKSFDYL